MNKSKLIKVEVENEENEKEFGFLDHVPIGMLVLREDFVVLFWNNCLEDWTGISRSEMIGKNMTTFFPHLSDPRYVDRIQGVFEGGPPVIFSSQLHEYVIPSSLPDGQLRVQHTTITSLPSSDEVGFYALFTIQDVTDLTHLVREYREMRDQALKEAKERKRAEGALRETAHVCRDGTLIPVELNSRIIEYRGIPAVLTTARDITERKETEEALHREHDELETRVRRRTAQLELVNEALRAEIIERRRVEEELEQRAAQLVLLNDIGSKIAAVMELDSVLSRAAHLVQESFGYHHVAIFTIDRDQDELVMQTKAGSFVSLFPSDHRLKLGQGMVGWVGLHGERLLANDVDVEPRYINLYPDVIPAQSELSVPLRVGAEIVGVLDLQSPQPNAFDENDVRVIETLADQIAIVIENARLYETVQHELTERKWVEEALRKYAFIANTSKEFMTLIGQNHTYEAANESYCRAHNKTREEIIGKTVAEIWGQDVYLTYIRKHLDNCFAGNETNYQVWFEFAALGLRCLDVTYYPYYGNEGIVTHTVVVSQDITGRKRAEEALEQRAAQLVLLNDIGGKIAAVMELDSVLDRAAHLVQESFGYHHVALFTVDRERGELVMRTKAGSFVSLFPPDHRLKIGQGMVGWVGLHGEKLLANEVDAEPRYVNLYPDVVPTQSELSVPIRVGKQIVGVLDVQSPEPNAFSEDDVQVIETLADQVAIAIDNARLYEAIRRELAERKRTEEALRTAHAQNQQLLTSISSILIGVDSDDRITHWNAPAETALGIAANDAIGQPFLEYDIQWDWTEITRGIADCRNENRPAQLSDIRYTQPDDKDGFLNITLNPFVGEGPGQAGFLLLGEEITKRKVLEMQLAQAQKLEAIGQLAAGIAHEISTPVQYIGDNTRFVQESFAKLSCLLGKYHHLLQVAQDGSVPEELVVAVRKAVDEANVGYLSEEITAAIQESLEGIARVTEIVRAMRGFSHPGVEEKTAIDINRAIEGTITIARNEWRYVAKVETNFDVSLPLVPCLLSEFNQAILNVLINAAHAIADVMGDGAGVKGVITVGTRHDGDWAEIRISDTGTGIPEEVQPRIFDPFFTTKDVGQGTGQGLAIAHNVVVEKHGGTIAFETEVGKGTTFIIRLPIENELESKQNWINGSEK